ncbi:hypothetical protein RO3G_11927 [Rhizopus delemar RA 99-880]|uniref:Uncharacterized protein n=1 Tax=Rhizopus delemar (strain RA 99-880 / ATCC MYA-4621 / FGSC 9543 / NRRL 43880) TaxID=246409 RepID=I1CFI6_RHIO9|nr:hypothetical protein RO3G_11927 [Rhizopus delemar RA 99-880]|eukprot:EIE87216.1 hypothetical protein RO3G_11927 [Rhizopus delemar RA 99-880]
MTNNISRRLEKRRMETVLQLNDDPCAEIEAISKKHRRNVPNENQEVAFKEIIKVTQNISNELEECWAKINREVPLMGRNGC